MLQVGQKLKNRYEIIKHLGGGSFGQTYQAKDIQRPNQPLCVVKQFKPNPNYVPQSALPKAKELFDREAKVLEDLGKKSDRIPTLLAYFEEQGEFYLVQDFIDGHILRQEIKPNQQLSEKKAIELIRDTLEVLQFIHASEVVHRDLKPENLMRRRSDQKIIIIDFGGAHLQQVWQTGLGQSVVQTPPLPTQIGTYGYKSPEQDFQPTSAADIYALGIIAIESLSGVSAQKLSHNSQGQIIWPPHLKISPKLATILEKMVHHTLPKRYQNCQQVLADMKNHHLINQSVVTPATGSGQRHTTNLATQIEEWTRAHKLQTIAILVSITLGIAGPVMAMFNPEIRKLIGLDRYLTYDDPDNRFIIQYPDNWQPNVQGSSAIDGEIVKFDTPIENSQDYQENVLIVTDQARDDLNKPLSWEKFCDERKKIITIEQGKIVNPNYDPGKQVINCQITYQVNDQGKDLQKQEVWLKLINGKAYGLIYQAETQKYNKYSTKFQEMIKSFKINDKPDVHN